MNDLQVRWARAADALGVATVHVDSWRDSYSGLNADDVLDSLSVKQRAEGWSWWIQASLSGARTDTGTDTPHRLLVAEIGDRIVGWASFGAGRDSESRHLGELAGLYVRSKLIGHALILAWIRSC